MIELNGKYKLKKLRKLFETDSEEYTVIDFYDDKTVLCTNANGEMYLFLKDFLVDSDKPNDTYIDIIVRKVNDD